jgi:hypothetical protein
MRVLVACEFSGAVRSAFRRHGHEAWSCDLLPADDGGEHIQGDVLGVLGDGWDLMVAHPPCTHLAVSGARYFASKVSEQKDALLFVQSLLDAPIQRIALENPVSVISTRIRKPDQIVQPYQFGHPESKKTCLWLKNLSPLKHTNVLRRDGPWDNQTKSGQNKLPPSEDRWKLRSKTYSGIAEAMASQWGKESA